MAVRGARIVKVRIPVEFVRDAIAVGITKDTAAVVDAVTLMGELHGLRLRVDRVCLHRDLLMPYEHPRRLYMAVG